MSWKSQTVAHCVVWCDGPGCLTFESSWTSHPLALSWCALHCTVMAIACRAALALGIGIGNMQWLLELVATHLHLDLTQITSINKLLARVKSLPQNSLTLEPTWCKYHFFFVVWNALTSSWGQAKNILNSQCQNYAVQHVGICQDSWIRSWGSGFGAITIRCSQWNCHPRFPRLMLGWWLQNLDEYYAMRFLIRWMVSRAIHPFAQYRA